MTWSRRCRSGLARAAAPTPTCPLTCQVGCLQAAAGCERCLHEEQHPAQHWLLCVAILLWLAAGPADAAESVSLKQFQRAVLRAKAYRGEARQLAVQLRRMSTKAAKLKKAAAALRSGQLQWQRGGTVCWACAFLAGSPIFRAPPRVTGAGVAAPPHAVALWRRSGPSGGSCRRRCSRWWPTVRQQRRRQRKRLLRLRRFVRAMWRCVMARRRLASRRRRGMRWSRPGSCPLPTRPVSWCWASCIRQSAGRSARGRWWWCGPRTRPAGQLLPLPRPRHAWWCCRPPAAERQHDPRAELRLRLQPPLRPPPPQQPPQLAGARRLAWRFLPARQAPRRGQAPRRADLPAPPVLPGALGCWSCRNRCSRRLLVSGAWLLVESCRVRVRLRPCTVQ
jgi:hypothetical protein